MILLNIIRKIYLQIYMRMVKRFVQSDPKFEKFSPKMAWRDFVRNQRRVAKDGLVAPVLVRHDPPHERIEQRHSECRITVIRTPDHALCDELVARGAERGHLAVKALGNVARAMRSRPEFRHLWVRDRVHGGENL